MKNLAVERINMIVKVLVEEKYISEYSEEDIDKIVKLSLNCLNVISKDSRVEFKVIYDLWEDFTIRVSSLTKVENDKTLIFDAEISFTDDDIEIEYTDKTLVKDKEIENIVMKKNYDILQYLLDE